MTLQLTPASYATHKGLRPYQEDRLFVASTAQGLAFGVFDGHGGAQCAETVLESFLYLLGDADPAKPILDTLSEAFAVVNAKTQDMHDGTTASIAFIPLSADVVYVAVLGDSPVIVKQADGSIWVAPEHNVRTNKAEAEAAKQRGGAVVGGYLVAHWDGPGLQMARALGDKALDKVLSRVPEISTQALGVGSFVLVCTDGALDPGHENAEAAAKSVVELIQW